ncbi:MAG: TIGR01777 family protein [Ignavibacteriales bacterium]|nr:TIGR01777 family protein [Ignavibacteriales bacterium]
MKIILAGATGFIGQRLIKKLGESSHSLVLLSRNSSEARRHFGEMVQVEQWDARTLGAWAQHLDGADAVINLAGESISGKRWSQTQKQKILASRIDATNAIVEALAQANKKPHVLINASAVGYYGDVPEGNVTEDYPRGNDFLAETCGRWEQAALRAEQFGIRVACIRTGIVLDKNGGALKKLLLPFRLFAGGPLGTGKQWFPWIHIEDEIGAILLALKNQNIAGPVNLAAPESVTMRQFCSALGKAMRRPSWAPVPGFVLRIALGEMAGPLLLSGQRAVPKKLLAAGYAFRFPELNTALRDVLK